MADFIQNVTARAGIDPSGAKLGAHEVLRATEQVSAGFDKMRERSNATGRGIASAFEEGKRSLDNLWASVDQNAARAQQYNRDLVEMERLHRTGVLIGGEYSAMQGAIATKYADVIGATRQAESATAQFSSVLNTARGILGQFGIALSVGAVVQFARSVFDATAALADQAEQVGVNVEALQAYRAVGLENEVAAEKMDRAVAKLTDTIGEAMEGDRKARDALEALGVTQADYARGTEGVLPIIARHAEQMRQNGQQVQEITRLNEIFGDRLGRFLVPALKGLTEEVDEVVRHGLEMGLVLGHEWVEAADRADKAMTRTFTQLKVTVAPIIVGLTEAATQFLHGLDLFNSVTFVALQARLRSLAETAERARAAAGGGGGGWGAPTDPGNSLKNSPEGLVIPGVGIKTAETAAAVEHHTAAIAKNVDEAARAQERFDTALHKAVVDSVEIVARMQKEQLERENRFNEYIHSLERGVELAGLSSDERERELAVIRATKLAQEAGLEVDEDRIRVLVRQTQEQQKQRQLIDQTASAIDSKLVSAIDDAVMHGKFSFKDLFNSILADFVHMLAQMAEQAWIRPIVLQMVQSVGGSFGMGGGSGGIFSGLSQMGGAIAGSGNGGGFGGLFGPAGGMAGAAGATGSGFFNMGSAGLSIGGLPIGLPIAAAIIGSQLGGMIGSWLGGEGKTSSLISQIGGALFGPLGGIFGAFFHQNPTNATGRAFFDQNWNVTSLAGSEATKQTLGFAADAGSAFAAAMKALTELGLHFSAQVSNLAIGTQYSSLGLVGGQKIPLGGGGDPAATVAAAVQYMVQHSTQTDENMQKVIEHYAAITKDNLQQFLDDMSFAKGLTDIDFNPEPLTQSAQLLNQINEQFEEAIKRAEELDIDTEKLIEAHERAIQSVIDGFNKTITGALLQIQDPVRYAYDQLVAAQEARLKEATALGADLNQVNALNAAEMERFLIGLSGDARAALGAVDGLADTAIFKLADALADLNDAIGAGIKAAADAASAAQKTATAWGSAIDALNSTQKALLVSDSSLSPVNRYNAARKQLDELRAAALGGDAGAAQQLASFVSTFLQSSLAFNASSGAYGADFQLVQQILKEVSAAGGGFKSQAEEQLQAAIDAADLLRRISDSIRSGAPNLEVLEGQLTEAEAQTEALMAIAGLGSSQLDALRELSDAITAMLGDDALSRAANDNRRLGARGGDGERSATDATRELTQSVKEMERAMKAMARQLERQTAVIEELRDERRQANFQERHDHRRRKAAS